MKIEKIDAQPPKVDAARETQKPQAAQRAEAQQRPEAAAQKAQQPPRNPPHLGNKVDTTA